PHLYVTRDYGKTWKKIVAGIAPEHFTRVLRADPVKKGYLYAGTETGMYISNNDGQSWHSFQQNMPIVPITDLVIKNNNLVAATQGRGIWLIDDLTVMHQQMDLPNIKQNHLFKPMDSYRMGGFQRKNPTGAGTNHPGGVMTHFYLKDFDDKKDSISISYMNAAGDTIRAYSTFAKEKKDKFTVEKGGNMHVWNLSYDPATKFDGMILWWGSLNGPKAKPGDYKVILDINGEKQSQDFKVLQRPDSEGSLADINSQFDFVKSINIKLDDAHQAIIDIRSLRKQMKGYVEKIADEEIKDYAAEVDSLMTKVEKALYQTKNKSGQDPLNFPIRLTNKLAHLNSLTQMGNNDFPPTAAAISVRDELNGLIDDELQLWNEVKAKMLPKLNQMIRDKALDVIILDKK
ncbi:MAG: hypothetical protein ACI9P5_002752, partial [Saprospiraceae bacterium]